MRIEISHRALSSLVAFGLVATGVTFGISLLRLRSQGFSRVGQDFHDALVTALWTGNWRWLSQIAIVTAAAALLLTLLEAIIQPPVTAQRTSDRDVVGVNAREVIDEVRQRIDACLMGDSSDVVTAVNELVRGAVRIAASDIHFSPTGGGLHITYRIDGLLREVATVAPDLAPRFTMRIKVLAGMDTHIRRKPQDGRLKLVLSNVSVEARVSTLPTETGERVVLRLVRGNRAVPELATLGFSPGIHEALVTMLAKPEGLLFVTGPVGSGKTTTLYAALQHIVQSRGKVASLVTLEDPIELRLPFATQTQINTRTGMTFASTLRSVLRQDPNILMVGEIRDQETAQIAVQAGLSGHLLLTTVHANSAAGAFARVAEMQIDRLALASAAVGSLSQRLVRSLCACRKVKEPDSALVERFTQQGIRLPPGPYYEPVGCDGCEHQGFVGRLPIAELLCVSAGTREALRRHSTSAELQQVAIADGMKSIIEDGVARAQSGETSLAEVLRVVG